MCGMKLIALDELAQDTKLPLSRHVFNQNILDPKS
jgi:hypothetical protein